MTPATLNDWNTQALTGLAEPVRVSLELEHTQHHDAALEDGLSDAQAIQSLGNARAANRAYRQLYLLKRDEDLLLQDWNFWDGVGTAVPSGLFTSWKCSLIAPAAGALFFLGLHEPLMALPPLVLAALTLNLNPQRREQTLLRAAAVKRDARLVPYLTLILTAAGAFLSTLHSPLLQGARTAAFGRNLLTLDLASIGMMLIYILITLRQYRNFERRVTRTGQHGMTGTVMNWTADEQRRRSLMLAP